MLVLTVLAIVKGFIVNCTSGFVTGAVFINFYLGKKNKFNHVDRKSVI